MWRGREECCVGEPTLVGVAGPFPLRESGLDVGVCGAAVLE